MVRVMLRLGDEVGRNGYPHEVEHKSVADGDTDHRGALEGSTRESSLSVRQTIDDRPVLGDESSKVFVPRRLLFGHRALFVILFEVV